MNFIKFVEQIPNITIAKRVASAYVADYRRLELDEIKEFLLKLGIDENIAEIDCCKIEHVISEETFKAIKNHLKKIK